MRQSSFPRLSTLARSLAEPVSSSALLVSVARERHNPLWFATERILAVCLEGYTAGPANARLLCYLPAQIAATQPSAESQYALVTGDEG
jgi:hypothetical protein